MSRAFLSVILCLAVAGCGGSDPSTNRGGGERSVQNSALTRLSLISSAFQEGQPIPAEFTCDGANRSPALSWGDPPAGTKSFALVVDDPDAPGGLFRHWGAYDIPPDKRSIAAGQPVGSQAVNDMGKPGYGGPCPPPGHGVHHYHFKLYALNAEQLGLQPHAKAAEVEEAARPHAIGQGELIGTYERK
jgi:Raf kinase inhibitor-like YbhB/YbcL family protein